LNKHKIITLVSVVLSLSLLSACGQNINSANTNTNAESMTTIAEENEKVSETDIVNQTKKHVVTFKDFDGRVLKTVSVEDGESVTAPINASKEGYKIVKWDKALDSIKEDIVVTPVYEKITGPTISVENISAKAGDSVDVSLKIQNNPGISGATIQISYDSGLILKKADNGDALSKLKFTKPGELCNPCTFLWDSMDETVSENGEMLSLSFKISENVKSGEKLGVAVSYINGAIYDAELNDVELDVVNGSITIE